LELLKRQDKKSLSTLYSRIYDKFDDDKELEESEISTLQKIQESFNLSNEDVNFDDRVKPYIYINAVRKEGSLPKVNLAVEDGSPPR
jgi:hypothetical protein